MIKIDKIISKSKKIVAYIIKADSAVKTTSFFTPDSSNLQVGYVVHRAKTNIKRHIHKKIHRVLDRTEEVLIVRKGKCKIDIYDDHKEFITTKEISKGDVVILVGGGHGFQNVKDTVLLEIKQGPYTGLNEKERF